MRGLISAFRTLTILPVPGRDAENLANALPFFPIVGAFLGIVVALTAFAIAHYLDWNVGAGAVGVALAAWLTRALHLDGLADVADALGAGRTRERRLEIMKDPHIGTFGVVTVVAALLLKTAAIVKLAALPQPSWIVVPFIVSRTVQVQLAAALPYARAAGGKGQPFVDNAGAAHLVAAAVVAAVLCFAVAGFGAVLALSISLAAAMALSRWMKVNFGGVTGDLLGMASESVETVLFVALAAAGPLLSMTFKGIGWPP